MTATKFTDEQRINYNHPHPGDVFYIRSHLFNHLTPYRLETELFFRGVRPAINVGLSAFRVGLAAQT